MGIINVTTDSFYSASRTDTDSVAQRAEEMVRLGADIIDIGACSTRPGAKETEETRETGTLLKSIALIKDVVPKTVISVDTFRASVARKCVAAGADIINDVSGGRDPEMFDTVAELKVPYVLTHSRGDSQTMQSMTEYADVSAEVLRELAFKIDSLHQRGVTDVIIDPGFGFAKTFDQNYRLLADLSAFRATGCHILAGISRKSMIYNELDCDAENALAGTVAANTIALLNGADILRVHDVKEASDCLRIVEAYRRNMNPESRIISQRDKNGYKKVELL